MLLENNLHFIFYLRKTKNNELSNHRYAKAFSARLGRIVLKLACLDLWSDSTAEMMRMRLCNIWLRIGHHWSEWRTQQSSYKPRLTFSLARVQSKLQNCEFVLQILSPSCSCCAQDASPPNVRDRIGTNCSAACSGWVPRPARTPMVGGFLKVGHGARRKVHRKKSLWTGKGFHI